MWEARPTIDRYRGTAPTQTLTDRQFTGQKENLEMGLYYYNARYYLPGVGRFISADTVVPNPTNPQSYNRYAYTYNNPLTYVDPSGHCTQYAENNAVEYSACLRAWDRLLTFGASS